MKRRENRQTLLFTILSFWCNFVGFFYLDVKNFTFFILYRVRDGDCVISNCFVSILFELLLTSYFDLVETLLSSAPVPKEIRSKLLSKNG